MLDHLKFYFAEKILDESQIDIDFMNGARAKIKNSWISPFKEHKLTLIGDKAMAVFDDTKDWNEKLFIMDGKFGTKNTLNLEANKNLLRCLSQSL